MKTRYLLLVLVILVLAVSVTPVMAQPQVPPAWPALVYLPLVVSSPAYDIPVLPDPMCAPDPSACK